MISSLQACCGRSIHLTGDTLIHVQVRHFHITNAAHRGRLKVQYTDLSGARKPTRKAERESCWRLSSPKQVAWSEVNRQLEKTLKETEKMHRKMEATLTYLAEKSAVSDSYLLEMIHKEAIRVDRHTIELIASRRLYMELCAIELLLDVIWSNPDLNNQIGLSLRIITGVTPSFREDLGWAGARKLYVEHIDEVRRRIRRFIMLFPDGSAAKHPKPLYESRPASFHKALDRALFLVLAADRLFIVGELKTAVRSLIGLTHATIMTAERLDLISERIWLASQFGNLREYISEMEAEMSRIAG